MTPLSVLRRVRAFVARREIALAVFVAALVAGAVFWLQVGRHQWFYADEWEFLAARNILVHPLDLFLPYNGQLEALPTLFFQVWLRLFHLASYLPYQLVVVLLYLSAACLLRIVMSRAGVSPWFATLGAITFVFLGAGFENVVFAAQVSYLGSLVFGLSQLVLTDHDGRWNRRDGFGLVFGALALLCSGAGVTVVAVTALAILIRRGWRPSLLQTAPLAALYVAWALLYGVGVTRPGSVWSVAQFVGFGASGTLGLLGQVPGAVLIIPVVIAGGLVLRYVATDSGTNRGESSAPPRGGLAELRRTAPVVALLVGGFGYLLDAGVGRAGAFGASSALAPRYEALVVAFVLPALALAVDSIWRRFPRWGWVAALALVMGIPGNLIAVNGIAARDAVIASERRLISALPTLPGAQNAPDAMRPLPESDSAPALSMGWLRMAVQRGWITTAATVSPATAAVGEFHLALDQRAGPTWTSGCRSLTKPADLTVSTGQTIRIAGGFVVLTDRSGGELNGQTATYNPNRGDRITVLGPAMTIELSSGGVNGVGEYCE